MSLKNLVPFFGELKLSDISPFLIEEYKEKRKTTARVSKVRKIKRWPKNATVNRELALLKHLFNMAIKWGCADFNPVKEVRFLKEEMKERILSPEEIRRLFRSGRRRAEAGHRDRSPYGHEIGRDPLAQVEPG